MFRVRSQIVELVGILFQVKQLLLTIPRVENVLPAVVGESIPVVRRTVTDVVLQIDPLAPAAALLPDQGKKTASVDLTVGSCARRFEECGQDVPQFDGL